MSSRIEVSLQYVILKRNRYIEKMPIYYWEYFISGVTVTSWSSPEIIFIGTFDMWSFTEDTQYAR